jgi:hypothetical protein
MGGNVLRETTSRGLCGLGCPSHTSERGGEGDCVKEGGGGEGKCERERALERVGTLEEPGTLILGAPVFPGSSRLGIEPKTPGWLVQDPTTSP